MVFNIAVVEDEKDLNSLIKAYLEKEGYNVDSYICGKDAIENINKNYHLWILDIMLGDDVSLMEQMKDIKNQQEEEKSQKQKQNMEDLLKNGIVGTKKSEQGTIQAKSKEEMKLNIKPTIVALIKVNCITII